VSPPCSSRRGASRWMAAAGAAGAGAALTQGRHSATWRTAATSDETAAIATLERLLKRPPTANVHLRLLAAEAYAQLLRPLVGLPPAAQTADAILSKPRHTNGVAAHAGRAALLDSTMDWLVVVRDRASVDLVNRVTLAVVDVLEAIANTPTLVQVC